MHTRREFLNRTARTTAAIALGSRALFAQEPEAPDAKYLTALPLPADLAGPRSLRVHGGARGLLVGCAVDMSRLGYSAPPPDDLSAADAYTQAVATQANILVAENAMKWGALRPSPDSFDFSQADRLFAFAAQAGQKIRGHNLCWHMANPSWLAAVANKSNARDLLVHHIESVAGRYAGSVHSWDVVNEAINPEDGRSDFLRKSIWLDLIGPDYIEIAFRAAAKADPHALLTYNDYGIELDTPNNMEKRGQVLLLVRRLKARGVPIHAVGIQSHLSAGGQMPGDGITDFVRELKKLNLEVYITELDVRSAMLKMSDMDRMQAVAHLYKNYLDRMLAEPNVAAVLTWGISSRYSWLNADDPKGNPDHRREFGLPFDENFHPTPAFFAMRDAIDDSARKLGIVSKDAGSGAPADPFAPFSVPGSPAKPKP